MCDRCDQVREQGAFVHLPSPFCSRPGLAGRRGAAKQPGGQPAGGRL